jgi:diguanylate cyclase (GGDEF)-like protein/PAS domain S-box-containing protein
MPNAKTSDDWFRNLRLDQIYRTLDKIPVYVYMKDRDSRYVYANRKSLELFGCSSEELSGRTDADFFPSDAVEQLREVDARVMHGESTFEEISAGEGEDQRVYMEIKTPIYDRKDPDQVLGLLGISTDITTQKRLEHQIRELAYTDPLTRLPNRRLLFDRIEQAQARCIRENSQSALLFIDVNGFKQVNDTFGHEIGDRLLQGVSSRILEQVRQTDTLARIGGDEFVLLLEAVGETNFSARRYVDMVIRRIDAELEEQFTFGEANITIGVTIGSTLFSAKNTSPTELVNLADADMYRNKQASSAGASASA